MNKKYKPGDRFLNKCTCGCAEKYPVVTVSFINEGSRLIHMVEDIQFSIYTNTLQKIEPTVDKEYENLLI